MSEKFNGAVTAVGASLITKAIADNTKMTFLKIVGSKSTYTDKQLPTLTDDVLSSASHDQEGHISNVTIADETTIKTELVLNGNSVEADYQLNTVLILATVDGTDHLFGVLKANQPQYMNAYDGISSTNLEINCSFKVANADAVSIIVDSAGTLTVDDYNRLHDYTDSQVASASGVANKRMDSAVAVEAENRATAVTSEATARSSAVAAETTARSNAISSEAAARAAADTKLQNSASIAASDIAVLRTSAASYTDTKVQSAATVASNATSTEAVNRASAVAAESTARSNAVSDEAAKRIAADTTESSARAAADTKLQSSATANATAADKAQTTANNASTAVVNEAKARSDADVAINTKVTANSAAAAKAQSTADSKFAGMVWLPKNTNADTVTGPGMYFNPGDADVATMTNFPTTHAFSMQVVKSAGIIQFLTEYMTDASSHIWFRAQYDSKFGAWRQIALVGQDTTVTGYYAFTNDKGLVIRNVVPKLDMDAGNGDKAVIIGYKGGDANGDGIAIGAGGTTVVGGGEAANTYLDALRDGTLPSQFVKPSGIGDEHAILASDGVVHLISSMQNPAGAHEATLDTSGNFNLPANLTVQGSSATIAGAAVATQDFVKAGYVAQSLINLEINPYATFDTPFIDFHTKAGTTGNDYDARIIVTGGKAGNNGKGVINIEALSVLLNGNEVATQSWANGAFAAKKSVDNRNTNQNPLWYIQNHGYELVREFKNAANIGITDAILPTGQKSDYISLTTDVPYADSSGGYPTQIARTTRTSIPVTLERIGVSDTAWSKWHLVPIIERG